MRDTPSRRALFQVGAVVLALLITTLVLIAAKAPPLAAFANIIGGALGSWDVASNVLVSWVPLLLVTSGLLITFTVGLWNIGIEGQITLGAIFATWAMRDLASSGWSPGLIIGVAILAGMAGGALWAMLAGALKTFGGVNEIFGGLGLNFVATALNIWLIFGPWKRPGVASMSGTLPFDPKLWMPTLNAQSRLSPITVVLALVAIAAVYSMIQGTYFGLRLKAVGKNAKAAYILGVPTWQHMMVSFALCGLFAGIAGAVQVTAVYHRLIPSISSGYGYLGLMVAMLINFKAALAAPVALFFALLNVGSIQLPIVLKLDSSLAGVLQGTLVLFVLLGQGVRQRVLKKTQVGS
ncbi:MAG TPA: ABC transporter permease [Rectinemataceae bacterium]|nr:ABC transporter permease [Rectinemataceae bacterium]